MVPRRHAEHLLQLRGPPRAAGRGEQAALIWDSAMTGRVETFTSPDAGTDSEAGRRSGRTGRDARRPGGDLPADGAGGGDGHAGLRPAGRHPLGRVRRFCRRRTRLPHRRRQAEGDRLRLLRPRTGTGGEIQAAAGCGDRVVAPQAGRLPDPAARCRRAELAAGRDQIWLEAEAAARRTILSRWRRPIRSTCSTPQARRDGQRAWYATTAAMPWRCGTHAHALRG